MGTSLQQPETLLDERQGSREFTTKIFGGKEATVIRNGSRVTVSFSEPVSKSRALKAVRAAIRDTEDSDAVVSVFAPVLTLVASSRDVAADELIRLAESRNADPRQGRKP